MTLLLVMPVLAAAPAFDPDRPGWRSLEYHASKLLISASTRVEARLRKATEISLELRQTPRGTPVAPGDDVIEITHLARAAGRTSRIRLWADPHDGAAVQSLHSDLDGKLRERTYRFLDLGTWHFTRKPADRREEALPPDRWTDLADGLRAYPPGAQGQRISETGALLWMIAASTLQSTGDRFETLVYSRRRVSRVTVRVTGQRPVFTSHAEHGGGGSRQQRATVQALAISVSAVPFDPADDPDDFELLGLRGNLELFLDPVTRAPLELRGHARMFGQVTVRLTGLTAR